MAEKNLTPEDQAILRKIEAIEGIIQDRPEGRLLRFTEAEKGHLEFVMQVAAGWRFVHRVGPVVLRALFYIGLFVAFYQLSSEKFVAAVKGMFPWLEK